MYRVWRWIILPPHGWARHPCFHPPLHKNNQTIKPLCVMFIKLRGWASDQYASERKCFKFFICCKHNVESDWLRLQGEQSGASDLMLHAGQFDTRGQQSVNIQILAVPLHGKQSTATSLNSLPVLFEMYLHGACAIWPLLWLHVGHWTRARDWLDINMRYSYQLWD